MAQNQSFAIEDYIHIIWYRKWLLIIPVVTMVLVTGVGSLFLPDIYRAYTLILVENQQIPEQYVNLQRFDMEKSMATIRQQIMSRSLLERVIAEYNLYPELIENRVPMEEILDIMRDSIQLKVEGKEGFTLFFQGADPYIVMQVTNKISSLFIEATTESRTKTAEDTVEFLERNKEELRVQLEAQEKALREFKTAHIGELPDQAEGIFSIIAGLQQQLQSTNDSIRAAQDRQAVIEVQISELRNAPGGVVGLEEELDQLRSQLASLQLKYTDEHPQVIDVKAKIANLEARIASGASSAPSGSPAIKGLDLSLQQAKMDAARLRAEAGSIQSQLNTYRRRLDNAPKVEQELSKLTRDYETTRTQYEDLLNKLSEAKRTAEVEARNKGQQFKVIDRAEQPRSPYKPNRPYIVGVGFALGLLIGLGSVFIVEHLDDTIKNPEELEDLLGLTVLSAVPLIETSEDLEKRQRSVLLGIVAVCAVVAIVVVAVLLRYSFI